MSVTRAAQVKVRREGRGWLFGGVVVITILAALARDFTVCKVNTEANPGLAAKFGGSAIPLLLIFRHGKIVRRYEGVTPEATLRADLTALAGG